MSLWHNLPLNRTVVSRLVSVSSVCSCVSFIPILFSLLFPLWLYVAVAFCACLSVSPCACPCKCRLPCLSQSVLWKVSPTLASCIYLYLSYVIHSIGETFRVFNAFNIHCGIKHNRGTRLDNQWWDFENNVLPKVLVLFHYREGFLSWFSRVSCVSFVAMIFVSLSYACPHICLRVCLCRLSNTWRAPSWLPSKSPWRVCSLAASVTGTTTCA